MRSLLKKPFVYVSLIVLTCFILFVIWNLPSKQVSNADIPLSILIEEQQTLNSFYLTKTMTSNKFEAIESNMYIGNKKVTKKKWLQIMSEMLREAEPTEDVFRQWGPFYDVLLNFDTGTSIKIKIGSHETWIGFKDMQTNKFYAVDGTVVKEVLNLMEDELFPNVNYLLTGGLSLLFFIMMGLTNKFLPRLLNFPERSERNITNWHRPLQMIVGICFVFYMYHLILNNPSIHFGYFFIFLFLSVFFEFSIDWIYAKKQKYYIIPLVNGLYGCIMLVILWSLF